CEITSWVRMKSWRVTRPWELNGGSSMVKPRIMLPCLAVAIAGLCYPRGAMAEIIPPGYYSGTFHIDRWNQRRFSFLFASAQVDGILNPYLGLPIELLAKEVEQPENPGGAMIKKVGKIEKLTPSVDLSIEWLYSEGQGEVLREILRNGKVKAKVSIKNRS